MRGGTAAVQRLQLFGSREWLTPPQQAVLACKT